MILRIIYHDAIFAISSTYEDIGARITSNNKAHFIRAGASKTVVSIRSGYAFFGAGAHLNVTASIWNI